MKASEAREQFSQLINKVFRGEIRVVVEKSGIPVAAVVSTQDLEQLSQLDAEREQRFKILDEIGEAFKDVPPEEIEREVGRAIARVRKASRQRQQEAAGAA